MHTRLLAFCLHADSDIRRIDLIFLSNCVHIKALLPLEDLGSPLADRICTLHV